MTQLFPAAPYASCSSFGSAYFEALSAAASGVDFTALDRAADAISQTFARDGFVYICGNGGSAAIANHSLCDLLKGLRTDTTLRPRVISLAAHTEANSALSNDISHDEIFAYQLESMARPGDLLWTVSSSGNSQNVVRALEVARGISLTTLSFTGFEGGRSRGMADVNVHVDSNNYGVVEDIHMGFVHVLAQFLRMKNMDPALVGQRKF
ncbi:D-sedoheptulose-7-phosphate isomerase [Pseudogemmobacter sonorensis]|uniref:D-sedoheptulose-7-phosphate isomerase n=1 Tax=Pseudogemmobacter sonorensis TaxID=2989681 RepID=UPI0036C2E88B